MIIMKALIAILIAFVHSIWKYLAISLLVGVCAFAVYSMLLDNRIDAILSEEGAGIELNATLLPRILDQVVTDVCIIADQNELHRFLASDDESTLDEMSAEYFRIVSNQDTYAQVRYIDEHGFERVRVDQRDGLAVIVSGEELQFKGLRYYFLESLDLRRGDLYASPLDLNVEQGEVEEPRRPMIRIGTPVFDEGGDRRGLVIVNYNAQEMLDRIAARGELTLGAPFLLNSDGYWLVSREPEHAFAFMFRERRHLRMEEVHPDVWEAMTLEEEGVIETDAGIFSFRRLSPFSHVRTCLNRGTSGPVEFVNASYVWILGSQITVDALEQVERQIGVQVALVAFLLLMLILESVRGFDLMAAERRANQANLLAMARYDSLTGLANRRTFEDELQHEFQRCRRNGDIFAVLYIDLDGFKAINDQFGHASGDWVLKEVAAALTGRVREVDTPGRLGGDEFGIVLSRIASAEASHAVAVDLCRKIEEIGVEGSHIGASIGIAVWPDDAETPGAILGQADEAMYAAKKAGKRQAYRAARGDTRPVRIYPPDAADAVETSGKPNG